MTIEAYQMEFHCHGKHACPQLGFPSWMAQLVQQGLGGSLLRTKTLLQPAVMAAGTMATENSPAAVAPRIGDTLNKAWKNDKTKFGLKMLEKMGWTEGKGLGKNEDGVSEHVKVAKKSHNLGLGATHDATGAAGWASTATSFNGVLEALGKAYGNAGGSTSSSSKKKKSKKGDKKRRSKGGAKDAARSSAGAGAEGGAVGVSASAQGASHCPSRARRVRSKDVKTFSAADLRAILGQAATTRDPSLPSYPVIRGSGGGGSGRVGASSTSGGEEEEEKETKQKRSSKKKKKKRNLEEGGNVGDLVDSTSHRPRTRSMDVAEQPEPAASEAVAAGKRPRTRSMDHLEGAEEGLASGGAGGAGLVEESRASSRPGKTKAKKKKKGISGGAADDANANADTERGGGEGSAARREKKRRKKDKGRGSAKEKKG